MSREVDFVSTRRDQAGHWALAISFRAFSGKCGNYKGLRTATRAAQIAG
jgi:hypothetical protein